MRMKLGDFALCAVILGLGAVFFFSSRIGGTPACADVYVSGSKMYSLPLTQDTSITVSNNMVDLVIVVRGGRVRFEASSCPDKVCVNTGWLGGSRSVAACVPADVIVRIVSDTGQPDTVIG